MSTSKSRWIALVFAVAATLAAASPASARSQYTCTTTGPRSVATNVKPFVGIPSHFKFGQIVHVRLRAVNTGSIPLSTVCFKIHVQPGVFVHTSSSPIAHTAYERRYVDVAWKTVDIAKGGSGSVSVSFVIPNNFDEVGSDLCIDLFVIANRRAFHDAKCGHGSP